MKSREKVFKKAESNILSAQKKQKETYDRKHQPAEIGVGTEVLLENTAQKQRKGGKLEPAWLRLYVVHHCIRKGLYELSRDGKVVKKKANVARLKISCCVVAANMHVVHVSWHSDPLLCSCC